MTTVFLTGATGFVGSHVARLLVHEGCEVHALVRPDSNLTRIADVQPHLNMLCGDILHSEALTQSLRLIKPDIFIHLAWYAKPGEYLQASANIDLMAATIKLALLLADVGCRRFVGVGTCFEYDTDAGYLRERTPLRPTFLYSAAKAGTFMALSNLSISGMTVAWARLFYLYGPFEHERRLVPSVIQALLRGEEARCTSGEQVRDFLHVEDVASALWAVAQSSIVGAVNVGSGSPVTVARLVNLIGEIAGRPDLVRLGTLAQAKGDPRFVCADNQRIQIESSWRPKLDLRDGLQNTIDWWRSHIRLSSDPAAHAKTEKVPREDLD
jgi:nucleoside-diphosphate-sugar epimerase